jgi:hypothetical protein
MALRKSNIIDALSEEDATGIVVLSLFDEAEWTDVPEHWGLLCAKLDHYLSFVTSGEVLEHYPAAVDNAFRIEVVFRFHPPAEVVAALGKSQEFVASHNYVLAWGVHEAP